MVYGNFYNLFLKSDTSLTNEEKLSKLKQCSVGDMLTLLRNIEESPSEFDGEIIKGVYGCLFDKKIICI